MAKRPSFKRSLTDIKRGTVGTWSSDSQKVRHASQNAIYRGSGKHKTYPSPTKDWIIDPKTDAAKCENSLRRIGRSSNGCSERRFNPAAPRVFPKRRSHSEHGDTSTVCCMRQDEPILNRASTMRSRWTIKNTILKIPRNC